MTRVNGAREPEEPSLSNDDQRTRGLKYEWMEKGDWTSRAPWGKLTSNKEQIDICSGGKWELAQGRLLGR